MGSSGTLLCSTAFVLVLLSSASKEDHPFGQREVTFDIHKIMQEMQLPDPFIQQKEADVADLFDPKEFPMQVIVSAPEQFDTLGDGGGSRPGVFAPRGSRPHFGPRSFDGPPVLNYPVLFPLGRPSSDNLQAICLNGERRPSYPDSYFPPSGFSKLKRMASAVNKAESWFTTCCKGNQTWERDVTLCCATQAWELSVESFCEEDSSVKDILYECCRLTGSDRLNCVDTDAPNPDYEATEDIPVPPLPSAENFTFDPSTCQRTVMTPQSIKGNRGKKVKKASGSQKVDINFPPGRPTADTIESLCRDQKLRPLYKINCLPGAGFEWLARQAKAINRLEKGFKQCCKKKRDVLNCADQKWREELNKYCVAENGKKVDFPCCTGDAADDRYNCFQGASPDPHYNLTSAAEELSLHSICDSHIIKKKFPVGFPLKSFVNQCCPLSEQDKTVCFQQKLEELAESCSSRKTSPPGIRRCCRTSSQEPAQCISKILMDAINKANNALRQKKKKKMCPLS